MDRSSFTKQFESHIEHLGAEYVKLDTISPEEGEQPKAADYLVTLGITRVVVEVKELGEPEVETRCHHVSRLLANELRAIRQPYHFRLFVLRRLEPTELLDDKIVHQYWSAKRLAHASGRLELLLQQYSPDKAAVLLRKGGEVELVSLQEAIENGSELATIAVFLEKRSELSSMEGLDSHQDLDFAMKRDNVGARFSRCIKKSSKQIRESLKSVRPQTPAVVLVDASNVWLEPYAIIRACFGASGQKYEVSFDSKGPEVVTGPYRRWDKGYLTRPKRQHISAIIVNTGYEGRSGIVVHNPACTVPIDPSLVARFRPGDLQLAWPVFPSHYTNKAASNEGMVALVGGNTEGLLPWTVEPARMG